MRFYEQVRAMVNEVPSLTVRDIAGMTGRTESQIYNLGSEHKIRFAPNYLKRTKGFTSLHQRPNGTPLAIIPTSALRAANLDKEKNLTFEVLGNTIIFRK